MFRGKFFGAFTQTQSEAPPALFYFSLLPQPPPSFLSPRDLFSSASVAGEIPFEETDIGLRKISAEGAVRAPIAIGASSPRGADFRRAPMIVPADGIEPETRALSFAPLGAASRLLLSWLLSLHFPRVSREIPCTLESFAKFGVKREKRPGRPVAHSFSL